MTKLNVSIPEPCNEDFYGFKKIGPNEHHCDSCEKSVVDFSRMADDEIITYFKMHSNVCGRFYKGQLNRTISDVTAQKNRWKKRFSMVGMFVIAQFSLLQLSCKNSSYRQPEVVGGIEAYIEDDTTGKVGCGNIGPLTDSLPSDSLNNSNATPVDSTLNDHHKMGKVIIPHTQYEKGDVKVDEE